MNFLSLESGLRELIILGDLFLSQRFVLSRARYIFRIHIHI